MNYFSVFAILYMTAFLGEMAEKWKHIGFACALLMLICYLVFTRVTRLKFFIFLVACTAYILLFRFPEVANHVNVILLVNFTLMAGILYSWTKPTWKDDDFYLMVQPPLRLSMALIYFFTGFHKFNRDFFNPKVSCIDDFLSQYVWILEKSWVLIFPATLILMAAFATLYVKLFSNPIKKLSWQLQFLFLIIFSLVGVTFGKLIGFSYDVAEANFYTPIILLVAGVVIIWELVGGLLLLTPKAQGAMIAFSLAMHASFALIGFVDFSAFAVAILFTFIPTAYLKVFDEGSQVDLARYLPYSIKLHRVHAYFLVLLLGFFLGGIHYKIYPIFGPKILTVLFISGMFFNVAAIIFFWPILLKLCSSDPIPWRGVPVYTSRVNHPLIIASVLAVLLVGMSPYLGLRTAGTFSMFSNLRTEGYSNHLILGSNPLKVWGYQEDIVEVLEIDDDAAKVGHKYRPLKGYKLPVVEFRKLIHKWTKANYIVPIKFIHDGQEYTSDDIVKDPIWRTPKRNWEMYLMDFRIVQPEGVNKCRW